MKKHSVMLAGLMGLFGGLMPKGQESGETPRPTVDDIWGNTPTKKTTGEPRHNRAARRKYALSTHRRQIAKASRKVNYAKHGTRG